MPYNPENPAYCVRIGRECGDLKTALNRVQELEVKWQRTDDALARTLARVGELESEQTGTLMFIAAAIKVYGNLTIPDEVLQAIDRKTALVREDDRENRATTLRILNP